MLPTPHGYDFAVLTCQSQGVGAAAFLKTGHLKDHMIKVLVEKADYFFFTRITTPRQ